MQRHFNFRSLFLAMSAVLLLSATLQAKTTRPTKAVRPRTVADYFMLLPQSFFEMERSQRKKWLYDETSIIDIKNDYILMAGDGAQGTLQVALFRYQGRVLVAVRNEADMGFLDFLRYENGRWKNVTKAVLPVPFNERYIYTLPRYGTVIKVTTRDDIYDDTERKPKVKRVYDLLWVRGKFKVKRYR